MESEISFALMSEAKPLILSPFPFWIEPVNLRWLVNCNDGSNIHFLRAHSSLLAAIESVRFTLLPHYHPLYGLMSSRFRRVIAFPLLPRG